MDPRANLAAAIRDYVMWAQHQSGQQELVAALEEVRRDVEAAPQPVPQGPGVVPEQRPGGTGERPSFPAKEAVAKMVEAHAPAPQ